MLIQTGNECCDWYMPHKRKERSEIVAKEMHPNNLTGLWSLEYLTRNVVISHTSMEPKLTSNIKSKYNLVLPSTPYKIQKLYISINYNIELDS